MSIINFNQYGYLIDHKQYLNKIYSKLKVNIEMTISFQFRHTLFNITESFNKGNSTRKRQISQSDEAYKVKCFYDKMMESIKINRDDTTGFCLDSINVQDLSTMLFDKTKIEYGNISGGNSSLDAIKCKINDDYYLLPPKSRFICGDITQRLSELNGEEFNLIIMDPPWWNKYIRRLKSVKPNLSYSMMYNEDISKLPIKNLLCENSLVAIWCTNSSSNINAVKNQFLPAWGLEYLATWFWIKVDIQYKPVCPFNELNKKQPYERLILAKFGNLKDLPLEDKLIVSVPSALHSHKPPLNDLLSQYINGEVKVLELFARYMLPHTTSVGLETLKWQNLSLYEELNEKTNFI